MSLARRILLAVLAVAIATGPERSRVSSEDTVPAEARRMSFDNRVLLNRAVVAGLRTLEILVLARAADGNGFAGRVHDVADLVTRIGGRVAKTEDAIGYLRVEVPTERLLELAGDAAIEAYHISSLSRGAWYRDAAPPSNAEMFRSYEVTPIAATEPVVKHAELPALSPTDARAPGYTADDAGVGRWLDEHPTYDGRGVTIAIVEGSAPSFIDPTLHGAKTLDGRDVPKIAGVLNVATPAAHDDSRVALDARVETERSWARVGGRTYVLPRPGRYRFGTLDVPAGGNVVHRFALVEDDATRDVWIDSNGDASFQDERPLADVDERVDPRLLSLAHPRKAEVSFVMGRDREPHVVHIYLGKGSHFTMTASVATGSRSDVGLASGVAPNARVLLVRLAGSPPLLPIVFEAFIEAARRVDVDVISSSFGLFAVPDTAADFGGAFMDRLLRVYRKPMVVSAGNTSQMLAYVYAFGHVLSVGAVVSPATFASLWGGRPLDRLIVHPISASGPSIDGAVKPDLLAPMERLAADLPWSTGVDAVPRNGPTRRIPPGYQISCCTSATAPYAAGVIALLISAAKQSGVPVSADAMDRALKATARMIPGFQTHQQGNGVIDVNAAWLALSRPPIDPPRITALAPIVHPLAQYAVNGAIGQGVFEVEGWTAGMVDTRDVVLRRESGPPAPVTYRLDWSGNDGTFTAPRSVTLPLGRPVPVRVRIDASGPGAHSALLNLRDEASDAIVFRTQATIVAAQRFDSTGSLRVSAVVGLMRHGVHYFAVPSGAAAIVFDLAVTRGVIRPTIVPASGLHSGYYMHVHPNNLEHMAKGRYQIVLPQPAPGTWTFRTDADSTWSTVPGNTVPPDDGDAEYAVTMRLLDATIVPSLTGITASMTNGRQPIPEPLLDITPGYLTTHRGSFLSTGLPNLVDIAVPSNAATLSLRLRSEREGTNTELYLYDCTTGECFSYNIGFPANGTHTLIVRKPNAGRWVAAVNAAPFPTAAGRFVLDEIITVGGAVQRTSAARAPGEQWEDVIGDVASLPALPGKTSIVLLELRDAALERDEAAHPWAKAPRFKLRDRPVALATAIVRR
jgi:Subtilase family